MIFLRSLLPVLDLRLGEPAGAEPAAEVIGERAGVSSLGEQ